MPGRLKKPLNSPIFTSVWIHGFAILAILAIFALKKPEKQIAEVSLTNGSPAANSENTSASSNIHSANTTAVPIHSETNPSSEVAPLQKNSTDQTATATNVTVGSAGSDTENNANSKAKSYFLEISRRIQAEERYPIEARKRGISATIDLSFELNDQGQITEIHSVSLGKPQILVDAAMEAVRAASPFSPPPAGRTHIFRIPIEFKIK